MKKIIYTIGILMFLSAPLHPWIGLAADESDPKDQSCNVLEDPNCRVSTRIEYALRGKGNKGLDWGDGFGATDPAEVGQNMYLLIYSKTQSETMSNAIKETAAQYGMPPERMSLILGGDITPILERNPLMRIPEAVTIYNQMITTYSNKRNSLDLAATVDAQIRPNEIFQDGDTGNSGFDLVNDLNNIEIILFKKNEQVTFGAPYSGGDSGTEASGSAGGSNGSGSSGGSVPIPVDPGLGGGGGSGPTSGSDKPADETAACDSFANNAEDKSAMFLGGINPNQCFATKGLDNALDKFDKKAKAGELPCQPKPPVTEGSGNTAGGNNGGDSGIGVDVPVPVAPTAESIKPVPAAPPSDYDQPNLCDDIICVTIDFVEKPATASFDQKDNCIACHVQYINDGLQKTLSHSLIPAKATGNLGEGGLCKNASGTALGMVGMNVNVSTVPIVTPAKDDLLTVGNITDEWNKFAKENGFWNYAQKTKRQLEAAKTGKPVDPSPLPSQVDNYVELEASIASDNRSQAEIFKKVQNNAASDLAQQTYDTLVASVSGDAYGAVEPLKDLKDQMKQMNDYFTTFQRQFRTLTEKVPGINSTLACNKLKEKQVCS